MVGMIFTIRVHLEIRSRNYYFVFEINCARWRGNYRNKAFEEELFWIIWNRIVDRRYVRILIILICYAVKLISKAMIKRDDILLFG